jgi:hypothetical protein
MSFLFVQSFVCVCLICVSFIIFLTSQEVKKKYKPFQYVVCRSNRAHTGSLNPDDKVRWECGWHFVELNFTFVCSFICNVHSFAFRVVIYIIIIIIFGMR